MAKRNPADRARVRQNAAQRRQDKEMKQYITLLIVLGCIVAAVILFFAIRSAVTTPSEIRNLNAIEDSWVVIDTDKRTSTHYHHPASFDVPAGYVQSDFSTFNDGVQKDFFVEAEDAQALVESIYVSAAPELTAEAYIQRLIEFSPSSLTEGTTAEVGEPFTATIAGKEARCLYLRYTAAADGEEKCYGCLFTAYDAPRNVCVYASLSGGYTTADNIQTAEQLLAEAETLLAGLTIVR